MPAHPLNAGHQARTARRSSHGGRQHRLDGLDGLRTIAVFLVILFHVRAPRMSAGFIGVDMFFVLSGYLITSGLVRELRRSNSIDLARFWSRRIRRLMPAAILVILVVLVWTVSSAPSFRRPSLAADAFWTSVYAANWHFISSASYFAYDGITSPLLHMWSLAIEEQFYVGWPLLLMVLWLLTRSARRLRRFLIVAAAAGSILIVGSATLLGWYHAQGGVERAYMGTDSKIFEPLLGAVVAIVLAWEPARRWAMRWGTWLAIVGLATLVPLFALSDGPSPLYFRGGALVFSVAVAIAIAGLASRPGGWPARWLGVAPMAYLGRISYGLYLWHWPFDRALVVAVRSGGPL